METTQIKFYYKNVMAEVLGKEYGITKGQFDELAKMTTPLIERLNSERKAGKVRYRDLPYQSDTVEDVKKIGYRLSEIFMCHLLKI